MFGKKNSNKRVAKEKNGDVHKEETVEKEKNGDVHEEEEEKEEDEEEDEEEEDVDDEEKDKEEEQKEVEEENNVNEMAINLARYGLTTWRTKLDAWTYKAMSFVGKTVALSKQYPLPISKILRWRIEEKPEPVDPFKNVVERAVVRLFLYPNDAEKSKKYIKNLVDYDDEVSDLNIDVLKRKISDTRQFRVKMELASGSVHKDQVEDQDLSSRKRIRKALQFANAKKTKVNALNGSLLSHPDHVDDAHDAPSSPLPYQFVDTSCKTLHLTDLAHVHNDDDPSSSLHVQADDASCKTLLGEVVDSVVDCDDRSPDGRITDVLAQIHSEDDIKEFGDAAQNGYETANEEVV
ncbi:hypothetical protein K7X08_011322 [Anisodus acutangulus]|uniref:Uncharacterized protein n=1 Tax=Anisodus acutangulus TaxID=402998 RepID=A0A9Q1M1X3_9SOLA|nr:hypothetical protein K7X08_011322 [Anisodus acutangulus]